MTQTLTLAGGSMASVPTGVSQIDPMHSSVMFSIRHLMGRVRGRFTQVDGAITIGAEHCAVEARIAVGSVDTGTPMRDEHLRSDQFFDENAHPIMRFASSAVEDHGDGTAVIVGDLTIHGTTHTVRLEAYLNASDAATCRIGRSTPLAGVGPGRNVESTSKTRHAPRIGARVAKRSN